MSGPHLGYIVAAYAIGLGVVGALIVWTWVDWRSQIRALDRLAARDAARRRPRP